MIKVKVTHPYGDWPLARQTPNNSGIWRDCHFFVNDNTQECDYWFVFDNLLQEESVVCNPRNTIIIILEFPAIRPNIVLGFLKQFDTVITYSRQINHPKTFDFIASFPWHIGVNNTNSSTTTTGYKVYDDFKSQLTPDKPKLISVISSNKVDIKGHRERLKFVEALKCHFGERLDVFGRGINDFADKWDVIAPYKYHIVLENSSCKNGISEKLYDSFLGESFPFYYGCPNTGDYFPNRSFVSININDIDGALRIIDSVILNNVYEKSIQYIKKAKNLVLDKYNIFNLMTNYCEKERPYQTTDNAKLWVSLKPESYFSSSKISGIKKFLKKFV